MRFILSVIIAACLYAASVPAGFAQEQKPGEYQVKAAFIYRFINFVEWPTESEFNSSPSINLCIIGDDPFGSSINALRNETIHGRRTAIKHYSAINEAANCHIIFISHSEKNRAGRILQSARKSNSLTVADSEDLAEKGAIISFYIEQKKVRFIINTKAARQSGLKISAKLLRLAKITDLIRN